MDLFCYHCIGHDTSYKLPFVRPYVSLITSVYCLRTLKRFSENLVSMLYGQFLYCFLQQFFDTEVVKLSIIDYQANQAIISLIQISYWRLIMALLFHSVGARALPSIVVSYVSWKVPFLEIHILMWL